MNQATKILSYGKDDIKLSVALRQRLEARLDEINRESDFYAYFNHCNYARNMDLGMVMFKNLSGASSYDESFARSVCTSVKTWYGMRKIDRLFILDKFSRYCKKSQLVNLIFDNSDYPLAFCALLIKEFTSILSDHQWSAITIYHMSGFKDNSIT